MLNKIKEIIATILAIISVVIALFDFLQRDTQGKMDFLTLVKNLSIGVLMGVAFVGFALFVVLAITRLTGKAKNKKTKYSNLSIVNIIQRRKGSQSVNNMLSVTTCSLGYIFISKYLDANFSNEVIYINLTLVVLLGLYKMFFDFRVRKGFYGNNEIEAREIIQFILDESDNIDFTDNGKLKKIISEADLEELSNLIGSHLIPEHG